MLAPSVTVKTLPHKYHISAPTIVSTYLRTIFKIFIHQKIFINYNYIIINNNNSSYQNESSVISILAKSRRFTQTVKVHQSFLHHFTTTNAPPQPFHFSVTSKHCSLSRPIAALTLNSLSFPLSAKKSHGESSPAFHTFPYLWAVEINRRRVKKLMDQEKNSLIRKVRVVHASKTRRGIISLLVMGGQVSRHSLERRDSAHLMVTWESKRQSHKCFSFLILCLNFYCRAWIHITIEKFRLEKNFKIIDCNCKPNKAKSSMRPSP